MFYQHSALISSIAIQEHLALKGPNHKNMKRPHRREKRPGNLARRALSAVRIVLVAIKQKENKTNERW